VRKKKKIVGFIKSAILTIPCVKNLIRTRRRKKFATSYYSTKYNLIRGWYKKKTESDNFYYELDERNQSHLSALIHLITKTPVEQVEGFFHELTENLELRTHVVNSWKDDPGMKDANLGYGRRIGWYALIRILRPKIVIETGVHQGLGSCVITTALIKNIEDGFPGKYYGTDIDNNAGKLFVEPYTNVGQILYGDSIDSLNLFDEKIDLFINDSDHSEIYEEMEYEAIKHKLSMNAWIIGDNSHVTDSLFNFSKSNGRNFVFFNEVPKDHWYPGAGIGISFK
jgi:hypothetical protein